ncbi:hypothetical protein ACWIDW_10750 [Microbacterium sp. NPDC055312]
MITPIEYDNAMDGDVETDMIDVTYPMSHIAVDTAGGFWTESSGSWLHIDEDDETIRRFNLEGEKGFLRVRGMSAIDSLTLVVSGHMYEDPDGGLWLFDTAAMAWTPIDADADVVGDVAVLDDTIFYVEYLFSDSGDARFVVRRLDEAIVDPAVTPPLEMRHHEDVKLSVTPDLSIIANTGSRLIAIDETGERSHFAKFAEGTPVMATNPAGARAWSTTPRVAEEPWHVQGGSADAHQVVERDALCDLRSIETSDGKVSPPLCDIRAMGWVDAETLIVSAGTEGASILAKIRPPVQ